MRRRCRELKVEDQVQSRIDAAQLVEREMAGALTKTVGIDRGGLLSEHPSSLPRDFDLGAKARRAVHIGGALRATRLFRVTTGGFQARALAWVVRWWRRGVVTLRSSSPSARQAAGLVLASPQTSSTFVECRGIAEHFERSARGLRLVQRSGVARADPRAWSASRSSR